MGEIRKMGASRPLNGRVAWGRGPPAQPAGGMSPEGLFANNFFAERSLRGHLAQPKGRMLCLGAFRPLVGREVPPWAI
jgi:hypothetical protein